jgi:hypothetical protein
MGLSRWAGWPEARGSGKLFTPGSGRSHAYQEGRFVNSGHTPRRADWSVLAQVFAEAGLTDADGNPLNRVTARKTWQRVQQMQKQMALAESPQTRQPPSRPPPCRWEKTTRIRRPGGSARPRCAGIRRPRQHLRRRLARFSRPIPTTPTRSSPTCSADNRGAASPPRQTTENSQVAQKPASNSDAVVPLFGFGRAQRRMSISGWCRTARRPAGVAPHANPNEPRRPRRRLGDPGCRRSSTDASGAPHVPGRGQFAQRECVG